MAIQSSPPPDEQTPARPAQLTIVQPTPADKVGGPPATEPHDRQAYGATPSTLAPGLILVGIGAYFLLLNLLAARGINAGGALFLALGLIFLVTRILTGQYGFAVPSGILLGFGTYVMLEPTGILARDGGWFFILLGLGFLAAYGIGARPRETWPFFPAIGCVGFGIFISASSGGLFAPYAAVINYWPILLIALGVWLLVRSVGTSHRHL